MNGTTSKCAAIVEDETKSQKPQQQRPGPLRTVSWNETIAEGDFEIPGTPKTPRTSTTPGIITYLNNTPASKSSCNQFYNKFNDTGNYTRK